MQEQLDMNILRGSIDANFYMMMWSSKHTIATNEGPFPPWMFND
jgi:hypothetical protein